MKIVVVHNRYQNPGGEDAVFEAETALLSQNGCRVSAITEAPSRPETMKQKFGAALNCIWSKAWRRNFQSALQRERPDIVHVHNFFPVVSPSIYYAARDAGVPVVQTLHNYRLACPAATFYRNGAICEECVCHTAFRGVRYGCYRNSRLGTAALALMIEAHRVARTWSNMVDRYIALTEFARQKMIEGGLPEKKITVKPNFVIPDPGVRQGAGQFALFVGRLADIKGVVTLLSAWQRLSNPVPLVVVGDGPLREEMIRSVAQRGLATISYRGWLPHAETITLMKGARFLVFPSEWYEGFPMTIVEALACGIPVICARLGSMAELVSHGKTGLHFSPGDAQDLAAKVSWAWGNLSEVAAMGQAARTEYETRYTAERNFKMLMEIYEGAISSRAA